MSDFIYPFDPSGTAVSNLIINERQTISPPNWTDFYFVIPKLAPYFKNSLRVIHRPSGRILVEGQDYHCTHFFRDASLRTANRLYGSITLLDKSLTGILEMNYQTLGGDWVLDQNKILEILSDTQLNPRIATWEQVANIPYAFPPIDHQWDLQDLKGMEDVVEELDAIAAAIRESSGSDFSLHINNKDNPHEVNKAQVGLSNVQNFPVANITEASEGSVNNRYMTPLRTRQLVDALHLQTTSEHFNNTQNPHFVTKEQVGLGNVDNFRTATKPEAETGTSNGRFMTPIRVKEAIDQFALIPLTNHLNNTNNPHSVTKAQVGLSNLEDYSIATRFEAESGISNERYMTPLRTAQAINFILKDSLDNHINNTENPHNVTKTQVGLGLVGNFPVATTDEAIEGTRNDRYMTPLRVAQVVSDIVAGDFSFHFTAVNNPHQVTKTQVGLGNVENYLIATKAEAENGTLNNRYMTPLRVAEAIAQQGGGVIDSHVSNKSNPHEVTAEQVNAYTVSQTNSLLGNKLDATGTAFNSLALGGLSADYYNDAINNLSENLEKTTKQFSLIQIESLPPINVGGVLVPGQFSSFSWTKFAIIGKQVPGFVSKILQMHVNGYDSETEKNNSCFLSIDVKNNTGEVITLSGHNDVNFYIKEVLKTITIDEEENITEERGYLEIWMRQFSSRGQTTFTLLSLYDDFEFIDNDGSVEIEPAGLIELSIEKLLRKSDVSIINGGIF